MLACTGLALHKGKEMSEGLTINQLAERSALLVTENAALQQKLDAVLAENVALKGFFEAGINASFEGCDFFGDQMQALALQLGLIREESYRQDEHENMVVNSCGFEDGDAVYFINETPATDALLNAVRAEGVEMFAESLKGKYDGIAYELIGNYETNGEEDRISDQGEIQEVLHFAAQLRADTTPFQYESLAGGK